MKYIKQLFIVMIISLMGEILNWVIPLPVPASVYGIVILFAALSCGAISLDKIEETADFLLKVMPLMFIPAGAGLMNVWEDMHRDILPIALIVVVSTAATMIVAGSAAQYFVKKKKEHSEEERTFNQ